MKKYVTVLGIAILVLSMAACGSAEAIDSSVDRVNGDSAASADSEEVLNPEQGGTRLNQEELGPNQLLFGAIWLENTEQSISPEQAADLLPLWKAYRSLINSDTAAQAELEAVIAQIEGVMTSDQILAIEDQDLNPEDFAAVSETLGLDFANFGSRSSGDGEEGFVPGQGPGGGGFLPGQGPGGPGSPQGEFGDLTPDQIATMQAERQAQGGAFGNRMILNLLDPFVEWLEDKTVS